MALSDGPRNFETRSSDKDNTQASTHTLSSSSSKVLANWRSLNLDRFNVHGPPLHVGSSVVQGLESTTLRS
ncbi:hypothetical protein TNCV_1980881 [Trichonephila clavipes]|nr:hypothetical protein TNCV_1980881 [Trichonephila clavipes]